MNKTVLKEWALIVFGLLVFALGVHLTIRADLGLAPWDCLGMGIAKHTPLNYGLSMTAIALVVLLIDVLLKEKIGFGTVIDALLTGNFVQLFQTLDFLPRSKSVALRCAVIVAGLVLMALGQFFYMKAAQGCGPRDALLVGVGKRLKKVPIGFVSVAILGVVLLAGWLLGAKVGIGTVITAFGTGPVMQLVYRLLHFEPREVRHRSFKETLKS